MITVTACLFGVVNVYVSSGMKFRLAVWMASRACVSRKLSGVNVIEAGPRLSVSVESPG